MRGIQLQQGCDEKEDYPLIIEIGDIGLIVLKPAAQESIHCIYHRDAREHEEDVCHILHSLQAMDNQRRPLIDLHRLHHAEEYGAQQESPARYLHQLRM